MTKKKMLTGAQIKERLTSYRNAQTQLETLEQAKKNAIAQIEQDLATDISSQNEIIKQIEAELEQDMKLKNSTAMSFSGYGKIQYKKIPDIVCFVDAEGKDLNEKEVLNLVIKKLDKKFLNQIVSQSLSFDKNAIKKIIIEDKKKAEVLAELGVSLETDRKKFEIKV